MTQPTALYLADVIANDPCSKAHHDAAAAELRRLHEENGRLRIVAEMSTLLLDQRSALLEALKEIYDWTAHKNTVWATKARAAIAKAEENT